LKRSRSEVEIILLALANLDLNISGRLISINMKIIKIIEACNSAPILFFSLRISMPFLSLIFQ